MSRYTTVKYEFVPHKIGEEILRRFLNSEAENGDQTNRKEYGSPVGRTKAIDIDYNRVVCIVASPSR